MIKRTPLHIAAEKNYATIATILLSHGADVDKKDFYFIFKAFETIMKLFENMKWGLQGENKTPFYVALDNNSTFVLELFYDLGIDINLPDILDTKIRLDFQ